MEKYNLIKSNNKSRVYSRETAQKSLINVIQRINEANRNDEFIYKITKAVLFGSYINSNKEKVGDLDIAIYIELKDKSKPEWKQNLERARTSNSYVPFILKFIYGKEEVFKYIKDKKHILQLHDGNKVDKDSKEHKEPFSYIYFDKYKIIYEEV